MVRVWTPCRLHFGLLSFGGDAETWPDRHGRPVLPARRFGGVGLMVQSPGVQVVASPAATWSADGRSADRALAFAQRFAESIRRERPDADLPPQRLVVETAPPEHVGLGVGTQLGLATARALSEAWGFIQDIEDLARRIGRGRRSALGVHGFSRGGFLVESGKRDEDRLAPLAVRVPFPPEWRVVLAVPREAAGLHGPGETEAFARLTALPRTAPTDALCRLVLLGLLPTLAEADLPAFGEALYDFNAGSARPSRRCRGASTPGRAWPSAWSSCAARGCGGRARVRGGRPCSASSATRIARPIWCVGCRCGSAWRRRRRGQRPPAGPGRTLNLNGERRGLSPPARVIQPV